MISPMELFHCVFDLCKRKKSKIFGALTDRQRKKRKSRERDQENALEKSTVRTKDQKVTSCELWAT